jgi:hypothetical protein
MSDDITKRMTELTKPIVLAIDMCESRDDILMVASYMLSTSQKIFATAFESEELANEFIMQYIIDKTPRPPLKKIV